MALRYAALARDTAPGSTRPGFVEIPERILRIARALAAASQLTDKDVTTNDRNVVATSGAMGCRYRFLVPPAVPGNFEAHYRATEGRGPSAGKEKRHRTIKSGAAREASREAAKPTRLLGQHHVGA